jgi:phage baseplate assembly protein W
MWDAALIWGGDLSISATGDLSIASGSDLGQQRVLRRLLTNPGDYIWQPTYGAGLGQFVGQADAGPAASGLIYTQIYRESAVARQPVPQVVANLADAGSMAIDIKYADANSGQSQLLSFSMGA